MELRGDRECRDCGTQWSYFDSGSVRCPECGSVRSVGVNEERVRHTDADAALDLEAARSRAADDDLRAAAEEAETAAREYTRRRGFIHAGELLDLDDGFLAAHELRHVADAVGHALDLPADAERYFLALLRGADAGERPDPEEVPASMAAARGLAYATAVGVYRRELLTWLDDERGGPGAVRDVLERLGDHLRRVEALDGDVEPADAERLVAVAREVAAYVRDGDDEHVEGARARLDALE